VSQGPADRGQSSVEVAMKFGVFFLLQSPEMRPAPDIYRDVIEQAVAAEQLGFDHVWIAEHHFSSYGYSPQPLLLAVAIAQQTARIRIGTAVLVLPLHHPVRLAEEIAMADVLSGGRLDVGIGRGYQPYEFERFGLSLDESRARYEESLDIILKALSQQTFSHDGRFFTIPPTSVLPRPVQTPHPPVWTVAQSADSIRFTVRRGYNCLMSGPLPLLREFRQIFDQEVAANRGRAPELLGVHRYIYVGDSEAEALAHLDAPYWHFRVAGHLKAGTGKVEDGRAIAEYFPGEPGPEEYRRDYLLWGTPDMIAQRIHEYREATGINYLSCFMSLGSIPKERLIREMEVFAAKIMPQFRDEPAAVPA
jgi:alkanesulfonate monooxygenase SsuD/methylene tetrahydromethanopterin reductase-like flavin-dependent oxidoreductase (luciferase family)